MQSICLLALLVCSFNEDKVVSEREMFSGHSSWSRSGGKVCWKTVGWSCAGPAAHLSVSVLRLREGGSGLFWRGCGFCFGSFFIYLFFFFLIFDSRKIYWCWQSRGSPSIKLICHWYFNGYSTFSYCSYILNFSSLFFSVQLLWRGLKWWGTAVYFSALGLNMINFKSSYCCRCCIWT